MFLVLAAVNRNAGSPDSCNNLDTARNIYLGRGFQSRIVQQFDVWQPLPNPETIRPPGIPFLLAGVFCLFGLSPAAQVLVNAVPVLLAALLLRWCIARAGSGWFGSLAGTLFLLAASYEPLSVWNNNWLVLATVALLATLTSSAERWSAQNTATGIPTSQLAASPTGIALPLVLALITAIGFLMKPTFVLSAVPASLLVLVGANRVKSRAELWPTVKASGIYAVVAMAATSPYWGRNLAMFGSPMYSPLTVNRLSVRYETCSAGWGRAVRWDRPETLQHLVEQYGWREIARRETRALARGGATVARLCFPWLLLLPAGVLLWRELAWRQFVVPLILSAEPLFTVVYSHTEERYLWPLVPIALYLVGMGVRDYRGWAQRRPVVVGALVAAFRPLAAVALLWAAALGANRWGNTWIVARQGEPAWAADVRATPADAIFLTPDPYRVAWYGQRMAVRQPVGSPADRLRVVEAYQPGYFLDPGNNQPLRFVQWLASTVRRTAPAASHESWSLGLLPTRSALSERMAAQPGGPQAPRAY